MSAVTATQSKARAATGGNSKKGALSVREVGKKLVELSAAGKHFEFMRGFYAAEMVSVEGDGKEYVGKEPVIHKSEVFQGANDIHSQDIRGPFFLGDANATSGKFTVYSSIEFSPKGGGKRVTHDEVGIYTVKDGVVTREEFYYDGGFV